MFFNFSTATDALFLDIDGTLLDIAVRPDQVVVPHGLTEQLASLQAKLGGALALISGRSLENIDALFAPLRFPAAGVHGAQWRLSDREECYPLPDKVRQAIRQAMFRYPSLVLEDKVYAVAVHYRQAPKLEKTVEKMLQDIIQATDLSLLRGKMVFEVVHPQYHKGSAIERFMAQAPFAGRRPVCFGDDETDLAAMEACRKLGGVTIGVGRGEFMFDKAFPSPTDVRKWLREQA